MTRKDGPVILLRALSFSAIHFGLWFASAILASGWDLDQASNRSSLASAAASVCAVLKYPYDILLRAFAGHLAPQVPRAYVAMNSVLWGLFLSLEWHLLARSHVRRGQRATWTGPRT